MEDVSNSKQYIFEDPKSNEKYVLMKFAQERWIPVTNIETEPQEVQEVVMKMQREDPPPDKIGTSNWEYLALKIVDTLSSLPEAQPFLNCSVVGDVDWS